MQYRELKKTGEKISVLGYGGMRFPQKNGKIDVNLTKAQMLYAIDHGVNYLDTAWLYHKGTSESFLGEHILKNGYREKVNIATKLPCPLINKPSQFDEYFSKQRAKLQVEVIDFYLLHALDGLIFDKMVNMGIFNFLEKLKKEKKVRYIGFSYHGNAEDFIRIIDSYDWDFAQVQFNIIDETFQAGINGIRYAYSKDISVFVMEPLRGGTLVGKLPKPVERLYASAPVQHDAADWALRWILNHKEVTMLMSGMNDITHIKNNIQTASTSFAGGLTKEERIIIKKVRHIYNKMLTVKCTGCGYCMPCPAQINIPNAFKALNDKNMFGGYRSNVDYMLQAGIQTKDGKAHWASSCLHCGKCERACPQFLPVQEDLKKVTAKFENVDAKVISKLGRIILKNPVKK
ncbi:MAG: hypothetical protein ATN36_08155 [Epulopiscium sp. Nele67-Bin005]|nr:MAG: hypothetical protein ATN36_08155 [Epulopiscium sp. Nele67-Bin005]